MLDSESGDEEKHEVDASKYHNSAYDDEYTNVSSLPSLPSVQALSTLGEYKYVYNMKNRHRGHALIVNNTRFQIPDEPDLPERKGSEEDVRRMEQALSKLSFTVHKSQDLTAGQMLNLCHEYANKDEYHKNADCLLCVMMSHGGKDDEQGDIIYATDRTISIDELAGCFKGEKCSGLLGKPKIFIVNACRGQNRDSGVGFDVPDASRYDSDSEDAENEDEQICRSIRLPVEADFLYVYSTPPGYFSFRSEQSGSIFIKELSKWLEKCTRENLEISQLLKRVTQDVAIHFESYCRDKYYSEKKQCPCYTSMLTKELYL